MDFNLSRIKNVAKKLNIKKSSAKIFTVAGTNGKGSTVAILESLLIESGYSVGSYTSPHILEFNERIKINKLHSETDDICKVFEDIEKCRGDITLTFFEFSTLAAFLLFQKKDLDIIILEVGLGGRLDAVNIFDPDVSIITNIGLDHTEILGNDLEKIAYEKSGIMRPNKPTVIGYQNPQNSLLQYSNEIGSVLYILGKDYNFDLKDNEKWQFNNSSGINLEHSNPGIKGKIQINNAATALQAIYCCEGISLNRAKIDDGLKNSKIFGRFQIIEDGHITILDIAHNTQSLGILFNNLKKYFPDRNYHAVFSVLKDKDINGMLELSKNIFKSWHISSNESDRALELESLRNNTFFKSENPKVYNNIFEAYNGANRQAENKNDITVVFGSSHTVAPILKKINERKFKK